MGSRLTRRAYAEMIAQDVAWLKTNPRTLERDHILLILNRAVEYEYGPPDGSAETPEAKL